jgi:hypothetical protein
MERSRSTGPGRVHPRPRWLGPGGGHWGSGQAALRCVCSVCRVSGVGQKTKKPNRTDCLQDTAPLFGWIAILFRFPFVMVCHGHWAERKQAGFPRANGYLRSTVVPQYSAGWEGTWPLSELHSCRRLCSTGPWCWALGPGACTLGVAGALSPGPCPYQRLPRISHSSSQGRSFNLVDMKKLILCVHHREPAGSQGQGKVSTWRHLQLQPKT